MVRDVLRGLRARLDRLDAAQDESRRAETERACAEADATYRALLAGMGVTLEPGEDAYEVLMALYHGGGTPCASDQHPYRLPERLHDYWEQRANDDETR